VESLIRSGTCNESFQLRRPDSWRQRCFGNTFNRNKSFFQPNRIPNRPPEADALLKIGKTQMLRSGLEQPNNGSDEFGWRHTERFRDPGCLRNRQITPNLDEVQPAITSHELIRREVVVNIGEVDVENLVPEKRERFKRVERVHRQKAGQLAVIFYGLLRSIQRRHGVVGQKKPYTRIILCPPLAVEITKAVQPHSGPLARSHSDFQNENLRRKLLLIFEVLEQSPEVGYRIGDGERMIRVGLPAGKRFLEPTPRRFLPQREVVPKKVVKSPDDTGPRRREWPEINALPRGRIGSCIVQGMNEFFLQRFLTHLSKVDAHFDPRQKIFPLGRSPDGDGFSKIRLVLNPIE